MHENYTIGDLKNIVIWNLKRIKKNEEIIFKWDREKIESQLECVSEKLILSWEWPKYP